MSASSVLEHLEEYGPQQALLPSSERHIIAHYTDTTVVVYQAFNAEIADYAVKHQRFVGCPAYKLGRMTWFKTNFMWMMYRCGWCAKDKDQARVLAIHLTREGFDAILSMAVVGEHDTASRSDSVRLQWDPDHTPCGDKRRRRAIQLGLRGEEVQSRLHHSWIAFIEDITDAIVTPQRDVAMKQPDAVGASDAAKIDAFAASERLLVPIERVYWPADPAVAESIGLDAFKPPSSQPAKP